jgi:RHS repeat-associated protein
LGAPAVLAMTYDALGNICTKQTGSSVASYQYRGRAGCAGSQGSATASPHAVSSVDGRSLFYDANGRMTVRTGATAAQNRYTDFSGLDQLVLVVMGDALMPAAMLELAYTPGGSRYLRRERVNGAVTVTRTFGSVEELQRPDGTQLTRRYIGGVLIETRIGTAAATKQYLFHDHLGSLDVIANESGAVLERLSFDAHGQRRAATQWTSTLPALVSTFTPRGFTGHEHLDAFGLIHMNGRVYDPTLGRFIQPDPMLDAGIQGLNRYSYVLNNPLSLTDPSGYLSLGQILRTVVAVAITVYTGGWAAGYWGAALTTTQAFGVVVAGGFAAGAVQSGTLKGGLQGAFSAAIFFGIGSYFDQANSASSWARTGDKLNTIGRVSKIVAHGAAGGIMSDLQGGKFAHGFASAGFSEAAGPLTEGIQSDFLRGAAHALIGGSASSLSGGKFANGAVTAAMSFSFNELAHGAQRRAAQRRLSLANARMLAEGGMRPFDSADEAAIFWHERAGSLAGDVEFGSYIFKSREKYYIGPVGSSFETDEIDWPAFGPRGVGGNAGLVGFIHSHPNGSHFSGQGQYVLENFPGFSRVMNAGGRAGDLGIAWQDGYLNIYASSGSRLFGWSQSMFLSGFDGQMRTRGSAFLNAGQYCVTGDCK